MEIRNIAIIAHVDHGKTTLTDALLRQNGMVSDVDESMDSNALEKERGITIYAKNTSLFYKDTKINIVDTPGHADFGSEVERVLRAVDSVLLLVDAQEGPMPQTKFVTKKSLELGLKPIVIINKIDKPGSRPAVVHEMILELFLDLGATDAQLDFTTLYAIGKQGIAKHKVDDESDNLNPILDTILQLVPPASIETAPFGRMQPFNLSYDNYLGRMGLGRVCDGPLEAKNVTIKNSDGSVRSGNITKLFTFEGKQKKEILRAECGDIVLLAGIPSIAVGETISNNKDAESLPAIGIDEPTLRMDFLVNNSPFAGREGSMVTSRQIKERLERELEINVGLQIDFSDADRFTVSGRGELHLSILLETMRREGFELQVSQPQVILKKDGDTTLEPFEELIIDTPQEFTGIIIEKLAKRKGVMINMAPEGLETRLTFEIPTRGLLGYRGEFVMDTHGEGILSSRVIGFKPFVPGIEKRQTGSMISGETGKALGYSLDNLQMRGVLYIGSGVEVYAGQVIGNTAKGEEMTVNPTKGKQLTNMRASGTDDAIKLTPPMEMTIERGLETMADDEYLEITPKSTRLRKQLLNETDRSKNKRR